MTAWVPTTPTWADYPSTSTDIDSVDLNAYNAGLLGTNNDMVVLFWNGTTYLPRTGDVTAKAATGKARLFIGTQDPATVTGVTLTVNDRWDQVS